MIIDGMHLRSVDLNLLVVLDALLDEASVTRAANRLGLSQPAASSALERCRRLFGDPLLERSGTGMRLTHRAESLRSPLRQLLDDTRTILTPADTPLDQLQQTVRLVVGDFPAILLLPLLVGRLAKTAPGIDLVAMGWSGADAALEALGRGDIDLALSVFPVVEPDFRRETLLNETYVVAMREGHPAAAAFDLDAWLEWPHVLVSGGGRTQGPLDAALTRIDRRRRVAVSVHSFMLVPPLLVASDMIAMLPRGVVDHVGGLTAFDPPMPIDGFPLHLAWHRRRANDPAVMHVAGLVREAMNDLFRRP